VLDVPEFDRWQDAADDAFAGAEAQRSAALPHWACFLAEQSAQLSLKGLLHGISAESWGHDLVDLGDRSADALGAAFADEVLAGLRRLSRHYIPSRYPDAHPAGAPGSHYGEEDAEQALDDAARVIAAAREAWRQLIAAAEAPAVDEDQP
jgi:HEPN domain-containing protein